MKCKLLIVEDDPIMGESLLDRFELEGYQATWVQTAEVALKSLAIQPVDMVISDFRLPGMNGFELLKQMRVQHANLGQVLPSTILITGRGSVNDAVAALKEGAADYITKPFNLNQLVEKVDRLCLKKKHIDVSASPLGVSPAMRHLENQILPRIAMHARTVLLTGESGVGKECVARHIHFLRSAGKQTPFVAINCAALPESLFEGELFGHEKGAYTGADCRKQGLLEAANGGTLFLDEIGELGIAMQSKLLRVVQEREFIRVGGTRPVHFDCQIIFATNRDLLHEVESGTFREDLFYRINVIQVRIPPLRERSDDIPWLSQSFIEEFSSHLGGECKRLNDGALQALFKYHWPGNVRELRHVIERACILSSSAEISHQDLWEVSTLALINDSHPPLLSSEEKSYDLGHYLQSREYEFINEALNTHKWQIMKTAQALGISRKALWDKMRRLSIRESK